MVNRVGPFYLDTYTSIVTKGLGSDLSTQVLIGREPILALT